MTAAGRPIVPGAVVRWRETSDRRGRQGGELFKVIEVRTTPEGAVYILRAVADGWVA